MTAFAEPPAASPTPAPPGVSNAAPAKRTLQLPTGAERPPAGLSDPDRQLPFAIANHFNKRRLLTAADLRIELIERAADGSFWLLDGWGPLLLHAAEDGRIIEPPIQLPDPDDARQTLDFRESPFLEESSPQRLMNALAEHAAGHGSQQRPVCSPWDLMLNDGDPETVVPTRQMPPQGSDLAPASSEVFSLRALHEHGFPVVVWTVNDKPRMIELTELGVDGIISDRPDLLRQAVEEFDADGDGRPGDLLDASGLLDPARFDAQGHRGARNLRPENTLPAMEAGLDCLVSTLETDAGLTSDGMPVLSHDPLVGSAKCRRADGRAYQKADEPLIKDLTLAELQSTFICDVLLADRAAQANDAHLSPVTRAFVKARGLPHPYLMPSVTQLFDFVEFYTEYYKAGDGRTHTAAERRATNAARVRFNIETKVNPRAGLADRTVDAKTFAHALAKTIVKHGLEQRADIQSFDFRTLLEIQEHYPAIRTVYLFGDFPVFADLSRPGSEDGTNLQPEQPGGLSPWLAGLPWPYRQTASRQSLRNEDVQFRSLSLNADGTKLQIVLENRTAAGWQTCTFEYGLAERRFGPMSVSHSPQTKR